MIPDNDNYEWPSLLSAAGIGGTVACCLVLELFGGAALRGGVATAIGLSTGLMYTTVVGTGVLMAFLSLEYRRHAEKSHV